MGQQWFKRPLNTPFVTLGSSGVQVYPGAGAPTDGTSGTAVGAAIGSLYLDYTNGLIYINKGSATSPSWEPAAGAAAGALEIRNETGGTLNAGTPVYISGWSETYDKFLVSKADADAAGARAQFFTTASLATATNGLVSKTYRGTVNGAGDAALDLAGLAVGDPLYLSTTAGQVVTAASIPTGADDQIQIVGQVAVVASDIAEIFVREPGKIGTNEIVDGAVLNAQVGAAAAIARTKLATDTTQKYALNVLSDAGAALLAAETAGTFNISVASNVIKIQGEITDNETEVSVGVAKFQLPPEYVAAASLVLRIPCALIKTAAAVNNGSTIDVEAYESDGAGAVGADICATAAATFAADDTWYNKDFTVTATGLVAGDVLNFKITSSIVDSEAGGGTLRFNMEQPMLLMSVQG